jgi:uncharacterized protein (DUF1919 family)
MMTKLTNRLIATIEEWQLKDKRFVLLSNNCWGYEIYQALGRKYNTPLVGLFLFAECYIRFLEDFWNCINSTIEFTQTSKYRKESVSTDYPIGLLNNGVEIHFMHYSSEREAKEKWSRRIDRLKKDVELNVPVFLKFCDRDSCTNEHLARFHALPFKNKLSIGVNPFNAVNHLYLPKMKDPKGMFVLDGLNLYRKRYQYFDISCWLSDGKVCHSAMQKILSLIGRNR